MDRVAAAIWVGLLQLYGQAGGRLEASWRQARGRLEAGWRQAGGRLKAGWRQAGGTFYDFELLWHFC